MFAVIASRCFHLLHLSAFHPKGYPVSSTSSSVVGDDDMLLPVSSPSSRRTSFGDVSNEKQSSDNLPWWRQPTSLPVIFVVALFPISTALVMFSLYTLPISVAWPHTLKELAALGKELHIYSHSGIGALAHVIGVLAVTAIYKHAWSIPGSVLWNVLAGALFSPALATLLLTILTMLGSVCATLLCKPLAPYLARVFPKALDMTRGALEGGSSVSTGSKSKSSAWVRLCVLRLIGVVPWSGINIACGVCGVSLSDCMLGAFIGCLPWTAVTCQIGDILQTVASTPSPSQQTVGELLASPDIILKLVFLSFLSLAPILGRNRLRTLLSSSTSSDVSPSERSDRPSRLVWVHDLRSKIRLSRSRSVTRSDQQLAVLIQEKSSLP
ncbi:hypothetical protein CONPUDRAFT_102954 [Coniophora puteana RWD-64-598 SS2]|uniref:VTT domain-containing protein n=1 Tax=Coniophora puteana (strain RWD-64-598) TaxID=741705 RepID=A0A5M3MTY0_CONPW|nr:uncharacterized protein CONPUDRAFT_102954 [Coniophora puteana RWD-64-598 SS2]EIW82135.1 hypothetical protein CONPUDRAFT_102954 [Coniophora puteana RWD-64-598 SS2]